MIYNYIICIASYILIVSSLPVKVINTLTNYIQCELISFLRDLICKFLKINIFYLSSPVLHPNEPFLKAPLKKAHKRGKLTSVSLELTVHT